MIVPLKIISDIMKQNEGILETAIVSARKGREARLLRVLETRQKFKLRQEGCLSAWISPSEDKQPIYLVQTLYDSKTTWKRISDDLELKLGANEDPMEHLLAGPPLVGLFNSAYSINQTEENGEMVSRITMIMRQK